MFAKFKRNDFGPLKQMKATLAKHAKAKIKELYPGLPIDTIFPKDVPINCANSKLDHSTAMLVNDKVYFFQHKSDVFVPTLYLAMSYPEMMTKVQVDTGAIKHLLAGSDVMAPGLLSKGAKLDDGIKEGEFVLIMAEGKQNPIAIGQMKLSSDDIKKVKTGVAIAMYQFAGDGMWMDCIEHYEE
ncbi:translation machinery-associated protein, putative [Entamoeba invadens IP1]|uniref:Translation machinery-associated protein, putative n=1 Tax=Entamoeba invadens IP1 TaxID=370355 RepID=A0A0A1TYP6_ENTIV|nr:translation machinery-associated protein, putative [Entamoeba invadens IP1]ELP86609.1 translation machinery-associated protein, putative [Entamoeba invadens IP1]|eukprot:XP_004185955.1 translation machinery-associated protein, putative [Entamoeba invadens IP1]